MFIKVLPNAQSITRLFFTSSTCIRSYLNLGVSGAVFTETSISTMKYSPSSFFITASTWSPNPPRSMWTRSAFMSPGLNGAFILPAPTVASNARNLLKLFNPALPMTATKPRFARSNNRARRISLYVWWEKGKIRGSKSYSWSAAAYKGTANNTSVDVFLNTSPPSKAINDMLLITTFSGFPWFKPPLNKSFQLPLFKRLLLWARTASLSVTAITKMFSGYL